MGFKIKVDRTWREILSELFVNLAAAWFGVVIVTPNFLGLNWPKSAGMLIIDLLLAIFCLEISYFLKRK